MKANLLATGSLLLLAACGQRQPPAEALATPPPAAPAPPAVAPPAHLALARLYEQFAAAADTVLRRPGQTYRVSWRVRLDTLRPLTHITPADPATYFPGDTSRGFQGYYQVEVRDSLGHRLGQHTFTKADFYPAVGPELAVSSEVVLPRLLGYSAPLGGLVFGVPFGAPGTDWYGEAVLILAPGGQLRYLGPGVESDGAALSVTLAADGRTLLTIKEIRRAGRPPLPLKRAGAELRGAFLLNDSLAVTIYEPGKTQISRTAAGSLTREFIATPWQKRLVNTFVLNTHTGQVVNRFRYDGFFEELGFIVPWEYRRETQTGYFLDSEKGIYALSGRHPTRVDFLPFKSLAFFKAPKQPNEVSFKLDGPDKHYQFYVDTLAPSRIRYQRLPQ